jgi:hypothetical protein
LSRTSRIGKDVREVDDLAEQRRASPGGVCRDLWRRAADDLPARVVESDVGGDNELIVHRPVNGDQASGDQARRVRYNRFQHRLQVGWRATDDPENLARRRFAVEGVG